MSRQSQLRLDAALRLEPLTDGQRDPTVAWEAAGGALLSVEVGPNTAWISGPSRVVVPLLATLGALWQYDHAAGRWAFPKRFAADVIALADHEQRSIRVRSVGA